MPKLLVTALALAVAGMIYASANPEPAYCKYCTPAPCFSASQCNAGCVCIRSSDFDPGSCVIIE
jgi:hypothetical protein